MAEYYKQSFFDRLKPIFYFLTKIKGFSIVFVIIAIMVIIIVPLPTYILDVFLTISIALSVLIILISLYIEHPTDFTTFPTLLLIVVLFRLSLNIATTRMILSEGHNGATAVSSLIASFGDFVVGGNYVIGIIVFVILVLINFMVVTNGSTRVAEVTARFTLDAMPGRQMAIDADLNAGLIDAKEAKTRRADILQEADFYGSMDGASKFVKGDAVAGIIITIVNLIGGFLIGIFQHNLDFATSAQTYTILTIGDGIVAQIPALITSTATGIIITRASKDNGNFADGAVNQILKESKSLITVGFILFMFALVPGFPILSLVFVGFTFILIGVTSLEDKDLLYKMFPFLRLISPKKSVGQNAQEQKENQTEETINAEEVSEQSIQEVLHMDILELHLGYQILGLVDKTHKYGDLQDRIQNMRKKIAGELGFIIPKLRISEDPQIGISEYRIILRGIDIGGSELEITKLLTITNGMLIDDDEALEGIPTKEPAFGLDALWIDDELKQDAIMKGYTVVEPSAVLSTHLGELIKKYADELLSRQDVQNLIDNIKETYPVITDAISNVDIGIIQGVLKELLKENISIKDLLTILETIADVYPVVGTNIELITEQVRTKLSRVITHMYKDNEENINLIMFTNESEQFLLSKLVEENGYRELALANDDAINLKDQTATAVHNLLNQNITPSILFSEPRLRKALSKFYEQFGIKIIVLSHSEVDQSANFNVLSSIDLIHPNTEENQDIQ
jgi:flagellar biosynthesis protein FlhA